MAVDDRFYLSSIRVGCTAGLLYTHGHVGHRALAGVHKKKYFCGFFKYTVPIQLDEGLAYLI